LFTLIAIRHGGNQEARFYQRWPSSMHTSDFQKVCRVSVGLSKFACTNFIFIESIGTKSQAVLARRVADVAIVVSDLQICWRHASKTISAGASRAGEACPHKISCPWAAMARVFFLIYRSLCALLKLSLPPSPLARLWRRRWRQCASISRLEHIRASMSWDTYHDIVSSQRSWH